MVGIQPGARYIGKRLPFATLADVTGSLVKAGYEIGLLGGSDETEQMDEVSRLVASQGMPPPLVVSHTDLRQTMCALAGLHAVIGSDTGLMHISAAMGLPTVVAFGPNPPAKWAHPTPTYRALQGPVGIRSIGPEMILDALGAVTQNQAEDQTMVPRL